MNLVLTLILIPLLLAFVSPLIGFLAGRYIKEGERARAEARLKKEPNFYIGARIKAIYREGVAEPLMCDCEITDFRRGRVELTNHDKFSKISFTGLEFEKLHPIYATGYK